MGLKAYESTSFTLEDCRVPAENLLGGEERYQRKAGFKTAMRTFNAGRPVIAANAVGMGRAALDEAMRFARDHELLSSSRVRDRLETMARTAASPDPSRPEMAAMSMASVKRMPPKPMSPRSRSVSTAPESVAASPFPPLMAGTVICAVMTAPMPASMAA